MAPNVESAVTFGMFGTSGILAGRGAWGALGIGAAREWWLTGPTGGKIGDALSFGTFGTFGTLLEDETSAPLGSYDQMTIKHAI